MMRLLAAGLMLALGACATTLERESAAEQVEPFILMIDAGRTTIFTDRINDALGLMEAAEAEETELQVGARNIRAPAWAYFAARDRACLEGKFTEIACKREASPAWLAEPPNAPVSTRELRRRIDDVQRRIGPLVDAACTAGKARSGDDMFCSVE